MPDSLSLVNSNGGSSELDINASITTTGTSDLILQGYANGVSTHAFFGVHSVADITAGRDLIVNGGAHQSFVTNNIIVGRNLDMNAVSGAYLDANLTVTGNADIDGPWTVQLYPGHTLTAGGNITTLSNVAANGVLALQNGSTMHADGNIDVTSVRVTIDPTASITGNAGSTSTISFTEFGNNGAMEIGAAATAALWQMDDTELSRIQNNFSQLTFGTATMTGDITIDSIDLSGRSYDLDVFGNDITLNGITMGTGSILMHARDNGGDVGDLTFGANNITRNVNGDATIDLRADHNININNSSIIATDANSDGDANATTDPDRLTVILNADRNQATVPEGAVDVTTSTITTLGGSLTIGGGLTPATTATSGDNFFTNGYGVDLNGVTINTGAGNISVRGSGIADAGNGRMGVNLNGADIDTSSGTITMVGTAGGTGGNSDGIASTNSSLSTATGSIALTGASTATGITNKGIELDTTTLEVTSTGGGMISMNGTSLNAATGGRGVHLDAASTITTVDSAIQIIGDAAGATSEDIQATNAHTITSTGGSISLTGDIINMNKAAAPLATLGGGTMTGAITFTTDNLALANYDIDTTGTITIKPKNNGTSIGVGTGTGTLVVDNSELALMSASSYVFGDSNTGTMEIGGINLAANQSYYGAAIDVVGNVDAGGNILLLDAGTAGITRTAGTLTATSLNLDAATTIAGDINATNVNINNNATGATLTGVVNGGIDQAAADMILGGPGDDPAYTFEGFTIRYVAPPAGGGGGGGSGSPVPEVPQPEIPQIPETPSGNGGNTPPISPGIPSGNDNGEGGLTPTRTLPSTVEFVSQKPNMMEAVPSDGESGESFNSTRKRSHHPIHRFLGKLVDIHPALVQWFDLEGQEDIL